MKKFLCFVFIVFIFACYPKEPTPHFVVDEDQLIDILSDMHIAQVAVSKFPKDQRDSINQVYKLQIAKVYNLQPDMLDSINTVLNLHPSYYYDINSKVLDNLHQMEKKVL